MASQLTDEQTAKIAEQLAAGRKIEAIKLHREATGLGLKESKEFVDALIPQLKAQDPEKYSKLDAAGKGCASVILIVLGLSGLTFCCMRAVIG